MDVLVDYRERGTRVYELLRAHPDVQLTLANLETGDYVVDGRVRVERKTRDDFERSIVEARLFRQANRLSRAPQPAVLILEGTRSTRRKGLARGALQGALVSLSLTFKLPILRSRDPEETVWLLHAISRQAGRTQAIGLASRQANPRDADAQRIQVLACIPGIGPHRAEQLLAHFGTLQSVLSASEADLRQVPSVGPKLAQTLAAFAASKAPTRARRAS
ncbi:MAG: helix-hairpin-helix domain-containing protein [Myxococcales bacterium]|nr:helix-hairpin-helix domain-containing protein [Myxococcales bacterium]